MSIFERGNQYSSRWSHGLKNGLGFYREVLVLSNIFRRRGVALWPLFSTAEWMGRVRHLVFHYIPEWRKFQLWHLRDLNLWTPRWKCTRNPLDRASTSERRMVYSRVQFLLGDILEPKVTCQRTIVCFDTVFSIMKTMTKYLLGMYIMTDITYMINKHSENNISIYPLQKFD